MKATGIVRRIDDLGRVVVPKEIRRTMRIGEGDPLEIYTGDDGEVIFKKYSDVVSLGAIVKDMLASVYCAHKAPVIACDKEKVIAVKGIAEKEIINRRITEDLMGVMERREIYSYGGGDPCFPVEGVERYAVACAPIIASGNVVGAILILSEDGTPGTTASNKEIGLVQVSASYLGTQLDD